MKTFNAATEGPLYSYCRHPLHARAFQILRRSANSNDMQPVGDYTVLDLSEDQGLSERKVINLVALLNGRSDLMDIGHDSGVRLLYQRIPAESGFERVMFRTLGEKGVSVENALLSIAEDIEFEPQGEQLS